MRISTARADLTHEEALWAAGYRRVAGADEAGRGAWAGPLFAAAVILTADPAGCAPLLGHVHDSKQVTPLGRERLDAVIRRQALATCVVALGADEIDAVGLAAANQLALLRAIAGLAPAADAALIDFFGLPALPIPQAGVVHGDALVLSIAAASILAKVARDRWMAEQDVLYPGYGFGQHKGYGTASHRAALAQRGPCPLHRRSFGPIAALVRTSQS